MSKMNITLLLMLAFVGCVHAPLVSDFMQPDHSYRITSYASPDPHADLAKKGAKDWAALLCPKGYEEKAAFVLMHQNQAHYNLIVMCNDH